MELSHKSMGRAHAFGAVQEVQLKNAAERERKREAWKQSRVGIRRPQSKYKGLTWYDSNERRQNSALWRAQLWIGNKVSPAHSPVV
jgi:hypothetical protein